MEKQEIFTTLFSSIPLYNEEHVDAILNTMNKDNAVFILVKACTHAHSKGVFTIGETEVLSKAIRVLAEEQKEENKD